MIDLQWDPDEKTLRDFGFIALAGLGAIAALAWFGRNAWLGVNSIHVPARFRRKRRPKA